MRNPIKTKSYPEHILVWLGLDGLDLVLPYALLLFHLVAVDELFGDVFDLEVGDTIYEHTFTYHRIRSLPFTRTIHYSTHLHITRHLPTLPPQKNGNQPPGNHAL